MNGSFFILILVMLLILWLFMIRPQRRRQQTQQAMMDNLRIGDEVMTAAGFFGTVSRIQDDEVWIELSPGVDVRIVKRAIAAVLTPEPEEEEEAAADDVVAEPEESRR